MLRKCLYLLNDYTSFFWLILTQYIMLCFLPCLEKFILVVLSLFSLVHYNRISLLGLWCFILIILMAHIFNFFIYNMNGFYFYFLIEIQMIYNVSGVQQSDSAIHICIYIIFQILFYDRLSQDILCYTGGPFCKGIYFIVNTSKSFWK